MCMYVCMYVCTYVCMYVRMYIYIYIYIYICLCRPQSITARIHAKKLETEKCQTAKSSFVII